MSWNKTGKKKLIKHDCRCRRHAIILLRNRVLLLFFVFRFGVRSQKLLANYSLASLTNRSSSWWDGGATNREKDKRVFVVQLCKAFVIFFIERNVGRWCTAHGYQWGFIGFFLLAYFFFFVFLLKLFRVSFWEFWLFSVRRRQACISLTGRLKIQFDSSKNRKLFTFCFWRWTFEIPMDEICQITIITSTLIPNDQHQRETEYEMKISNVNRSLKIILPRIFNSSKLT